MPQQHGLEESNEFRVRNDNFQSIHLNDAVKESSKQKIEKRSYDEKIEQLEAMLLSLQGATKVSDH